MKTVLSWSPAVLLCLALAAPRSADAAGFQNMSQSATANAMGSMGTANPDEPNASFYNAATLAQRDGFELYIGGTLLMPSTTYEPIDPNDGEAAATTPRQFYPPNMHLGVPIELGGAGTLGLGLGVTFPYGLGITWPDDWDGDHLIISQDLQAVSINPNVSYKLPGMDLSFALGAQIYRASVTLVRDAVIRDDYDVKTTISGVGQGYGAAASLLYKPIEPLSIGLNYRSAARLKVGGQVHFEGEEGTPFEQTFSDQDGSTELQIPHAFTLGVGYDLADKLFIGVDVVYTAWSGYDQIVLEFSEECLEGSVSCDPTVDKTDPPPSTITSNWEDALALRLGVEYEVIPDLKLRVGGAFDQTPIPERTLSPSLPGNDRASFSAGLGYVVSGVRADLGYQFVRALDREVIDTDNLPGTYSTTAHVIGLNIGYGY